MTPESEPVLDDAARLRLTRALREWYASRNSHMRAEQELREAIPPGVAVLHCLPGEAGKPGTVYWTFWRDTRGEVSWGVTRQGEETRAVIVEAPAPREEFLPRLGGDAP